MIFSTRAQISRAGQWQWRHRGRRHGGAARYERLGSGKHLLYLRSSLLQCDGHRWVAADLAADRAVLV